MKIVNYCMLSIVLLSSASHAEVMIESETTMQEPAQANHHAQIPPEEQHAHSILPACLDMLQNLAGIVLDPTNPSVVGPNTIYILQDIATIVHELMQSHADSSQEMKDIAAQMTETLMELKNEMDRYMAIHEKNMTKQTCKRTHATALQTEEKEHAEKIIAHIVSIIRNIGDLTQHPHDAEKLTENIAQMVDCLLHIGLEIKEIRHINA